MKKKIITAISTLAVFTAGFTTGMIMPDISANSDSSFNFDVNSDGEVNITDLILLKNYLLNSEKEITDFTFDTVQEDCYAEKVQMVINSYDELCSLTDKLEYSGEYIKGKYNEDYFKTKSIVVICTDTDYDTTYKLNKVTADNNTIKINLEAEVFNHGYPSSVYNVLIIGYNKSDFLGENCDIKINEYPMCADKPVIYLYPEEETDVNVKLDIKNGNLVCTYPEYPEKTGWNVTAMPDGTVYNEDGLEYSYLYWEGVSDIDYDMSEGFVVKGEDTAEFLREKLSYMGLTPREYNEFIVYWLPRMQNNKYNLIKFQGEQYTENAVLDITPKPDSMLRVFMTYKPLDEYIEIPEQKLETFERKGFAVVEWGGSEINSDIAE